MKKIGWTALFFCLMGSYSLCAQNSEMAKKILDKAANKIYNASGIEATFDMSVQNKQANVNDSYAGTIQLSTVKYRLVILNTETYFDGKTQWTYMKDDNEVDITLPDSTDKGMTPANIFSMYKKGFKFVYNGETKEGERLLYSIDLLPENKEESYSKVNVKVDKVTDNFVAFESFGKDGVDNLIKINSIDLKKNYKDSYFVFDASAHKGVDVVDLR